MSATRELRIYDVPLHDALDIAQLLVTQREGVQLHRTNQENVFISPAFDDGLRWVVTGRALGPRRCSVGIYLARLFSQADTVMTHNPDNPPAETPAAPTVDDNTWVPDPASLDVFRSFELEPELAERLDALAATEQPAQPAKVSQAPGAPLEVHSEAPPGSPEAAAAADGGVALAAAPPDGEAPAPDASAAAAEEEPAASAPNPPPRIVESAGDCGLAAEDIDDFFQPGNLLLVGDRLGTREIPDAFGSLVCRAVHKQLTIVVAVDIPHAEQRRVEAFLRSDGSAGARAALLTGAFWHWPYPDGSSSIAMVDLLDRLRGWRQAGARLHVITLGPGAMAGNPREAAIATQLAAMRRKNPRVFTLVLAGNAHTIRRPGTPWDPELLPFGYRLGAVDAAHVMSLDPVFLAGNAWNCLLSAGGKLRCGVAFVRPPLSVPVDNLHVKGLHRVIRYQATNDSGFDGLIDVGYLHPSLPAVDPAAANRQGSDDQLR